MMKCADCKRELELHETRPVDGNIYCDGCADKRLDLQAKRFMPET